MDITTHVDFSRYAEFVNEVTSKESKDAVAFTQRINGLQTQGCDVHRLLTAAVGISAEGGEFMEIVKKIVFQGKPWSEDNIEHLQIELGDILWYVAQACMALNVKFDDVVLRNVNKLMKRYPEGTFDSYFSENRAADDR